MSNLFVERKFELYRLEVEAIGREKERQLLCASCSPFTSSASSSPSLSNSISLVQNPYASMEKPPCQASKRCRSDCVDEVEWEKECAYRQQPDGYCLTEEDVQVLERETTRLAAENQQEHQDVPCDRSTGADLDDEAGDTTTAKRADSVRCEGATPSINREDEEGGLSLPTSEDGDTSGLYGELTSRGVRQMHYCHMRTLIQALSTSATARDGAAEAMVVLAVDIGSGTGKVVYEWGRLGAHEGKALQSHLHNRPHSSWDYRFATLGVELVPSRMAVARRVIREAGSQLVEIVAPEGAGVDAGLLQVQQASEEGTSKETGSYLLTEVSALHPQLLTNTLLCPTQRQPTGWYPVAWQLARPDGPTAAHFAGLCCGVGFSESFVHRLCLQLERMVEDTVITARGDGSGDGWRSFSVLLLLPPLKDVHQVPLFRAARRWDRWLGTVPQRTDGGWCSASTPEVDAEKAKHNGSYSGSDLTEVQRVRPDSELPEWCRSSEDGSGANSNNNGITDSWVTATHVETSWCSETPAWHIGFLISSSVSR